MPALSFPSKKKNNILSVGAMGVAWGIGITNAVQITFPIPRGAKCYVKSAGRGKTLEEIGINRRRELFTYKSGETIVSDPTPTGILKKFSAETDLITMNTAFKNWTSLWFSIDNGATFVNGYDLRNYHSICHTMERSRVDRYDHVVA